MPTARLRSIVPIFGGATNYAETLNAILDYVDEQHLTTDELAANNLDAISAGLSPAPQADGPESRIGRLISS